MEKINRVQRRRTKGFKLPDNTRCVNRGTRWGNPIKLKGDQIYIHAGYRRKLLDPWVWYATGDIHDVINLYRELWEKDCFDNPDLQHLSNRIKELPIQELKGKNLACFCSLDSPCHADVLLEKANK